MRVPHSRALYADADITGITRLALIQIAPPLRGAFVHDVCRARSGEHLARSESAPFIRLDRPGAFRP